MGDTAVTAPHNHSDADVTTLQIPSDWLRAFRQCLYSLSSEVRRWGGKGPWLVFQGRTAGGENQAQPVLMTNVGGQEPGTFGKPLIFWTLFHQGKSA